ncbi:hypothetical protein GS479_07110 [Rhodococcus hoagii]|nr:hypothetical protein [Prescottella equi]
MQSAVGRHLVAQRGGEAEEHELLRLSAGQPRTGIVQLLKGPLVTSRKHPDVWRTIIREERLRDIAGRVLAAPEMHQLDQRDRVGVGAGAIGEGDRAPGRAIAQVRGA